MKKRTKIILISLISLLAIVFIFAKLKRVSPLSWNAHKVVNQPITSSEAINGYDPVSYFVGDAPQQGDKAFSYKYNDALWYFVSQENRIRFMGNPERYLPKYGGYCAFAVSKGFTANSNPMSFEFIRGELYLFADDGIKSDYMKSVDRNVEKSDQNWRNE